VSLWQGMKGAGRENRRVLHAAQAPNDASRMEALAGIWTPQGLKSSCEWPQAFTRLQHDSVSVAAKLWRK